MNSLQRNCNNAYKYKNDGYSCTLILQAFNSCWLLGFFARNYWNCIRLHADRYTGIPFRRRICSYELETLKRHRKAIEQDIENQFETNKRQPEDGGKRHFINMDIQCTDHGLHKVGPVYAAIWENCQATAFILNWRYLLWRSI